MGYLADITKQLSNGQEVIFVGTGIIVVDRFNRILIARRSDNNQWCIPGGSLEVGESLKACAVRELFEETAIRADESDLELNSAEALPEPIIKNGREIYVVSISFIVREYDDIDFDIDSREFTKYGWLTLNEIDRLPSITSYTKVALERFKDKIKEGG